MARNRKTNYKKKVEKDVFPAPLAAVLSLVTVLALSYLWLCGQCEASGRRIKKLEQNKEVVRKLRLNEEFKWHNLRSQEELEKALALHGLQMNWPEKRRAIQLIKGTYRYDDEVSYSTTANEGDSGLRMAMR